jgi:hypothetical protein
VSKLLVTITTLSIAAFLVLPAEARADVTLEVAPADYSFGQHITFHLSATAPAVITEVNLFFRVQGQSDTTAIAVPVAPAQQMAISYAYSMAGNNVPPFALITYWWEVRLESGEIHRSEEQLLYYAENRYDWRVVRSQQSNMSWEVFWVQGDVAFGQAALNSAMKALDELSLELRTSVPGVIRIFIYPSEEDLRSALNLAGYDWAAGQARPELGVILAGIPDNSAAPGEMERLIPHELAHLLVFEATGQRLGKVPPWLDEGLATLSELRPDPNREALVEQALAQDRLFPLEALCAPFPSDENAARLAYAQSASLVEYLREEKGSQVIRDLLAAYANNASCAAGVNQVLDTSLEGLDAAWRAHQTPQGTLDVSPSNSALWIGLWLLTALLAAPLAGVLRRRNSEPGRG